GVVEDAFAGRGLAGIDVGHDAEITVALDRIFAGHGALPLPAVVREGTVGVGHPVRVLALLHGLTAAVERIHELARQALLHGVLAALAGAVDQPADGERLLALRPDLDGNLIGGTANAARAHLDGGTDIVQRRVE